MNHHKTSKRALSIQDMRRIIEFDPGSESHLHVAKDLFLLCFMLRGLAFVDLFYMKKSNMHGTYLQFSRHKTAVPITIALTHETHVLIERYKSRQPSSPFLFYFLDHHTDPHAIYKAYRTALKRQNRALHVIGKQLGLSISLSSYVARHAWATQAKMSGASLAHISEAMGHTSQRTTYIYLKNFEQITIDNLNNAVVKPYLRCFHEVYSTSGKTVLNQSNKRNE